MTSGVAVFDSLKPTFDSKWPRMRRRPAVLTDAALLQRFHPASLAVKWRGQGYALAFCLAPVVSLLLATLFLPIEPGTLLGQAFLGCSAYLSLRLLSDRPLVNPVQSVVLVFQWWYGVGPALCGIYFGALGNSDKQFLYTGDNAGVLWVVGAGLLLYALSARLVIRMYENFAPSATALRPSGPVYKIRTIAAFAILAASIKGVLYIFGTFGIVAFETVNYLGGQRTRSAPLAVFALVAQVGDFAVCSLLAYLVVPGTKTSGWPFRVLAAVVAVLAMGSALTSGTKGLILQPVLWAVLLFMIWRRKVPWVLIIAGIALYLFFVEPFVAQSRLAAEQSTLSTTQERSELFLYRMLQYRPHAFDWNTLNIESPFRAIYTNDIEIARRSTVFEGPWSGRSLNLGLSAILPRAISPDKADSNMGNYFAQELGQTHGTMQNIAISIPFEFVGNYGFLAGVGSFALIGACWTCFCCAILTPDRLATHPLTPFFISTMMALEGSLGQFVNQIKVLTIPLVAVWVISSFSKKNL